MPVPCMSTASMTLSYHVSNYKDFILFQQTHELLCGCYVYVFSWFTRLRTYPHASYNRAWRVFAVGSPGRRADGMFIRVDLVCFPR